jgi:hypothetical protein
LIGKSDLRRKKEMKTTLCRSVILLALVLMASAAFGQGTQSGAISGAITDPSGAVISGATVTVTNTATNNVERTVVTTGDGLFSATLLPPGEYSINVKAANFKTLTRKVTVQLNQTTRADAVLQVGAATETVEVSAMAVTVNTESAVTGTPIDSQTLQALPLPVPNFMFLLSLSAGTTGEMPDVRSGEPRHC